MAEFIIELIIDIIVEGSIELSTAKKVPMIFRILASLICLVFFGGLFLLFLVLAIQGYQDGNAVSGTILAAITVGYAVLAVYAFRKKVKESRQKKPEAEGKKTYNTDGIEGDF